MDFQICLKYAYALVVFLIFCDFGNFAFNCVMQHHWATACLFVDQMVTLAGYKVLSGRLV